MSERALTAMRWVLSALFLALPLSLMTVDPPSGTTEMLQVGLFLTPWALASLGVLFRVPAARGFALGVSALSGVAFLLANGFELPDGWRDSLLLAQVLGLALALPAFGRVFSDHLRLRWTAAAVGFAVPAAVLFAVFSSGPARVFGWGAVALIALGVIGLAFSRTWSLFALLGGALAVAVSPLLADVDPVIATVDTATVTTALGWIAGLALASAWLPWIAPVFRKLRG